MIISTITGANPAGTYTFTNYVDTTSSRTARITGVTTFNRHQPNAGTWDTILQNWDTWPNNFDNWSDEQAAFNDTSVEVFVAATPTKEQHNESSKVYYINNKVKVDEYNKQYIKNKIRS